MGNTLVVGAAVGTNPKIANLVKARELARALPLGGWPTLTLETKMKQCCSAGAARSRQSRRFQHS
jgi:hypothetical protein